MNQSIKYILISFLFFQANAFSIPVDIDSVLINYTFTSIEEKIDTLLEISAGQIRAYQYEDALILAEYALNLSKSINYLPGEGNSYSVIGNVHMGKQENLKALKYLDTSLTIRKKLNDNMGLISDLTSKGIIYYRLGMSEKALNNYLKAINVTDSTEETQKIISLHNNIGLIYFGLDNHNKALDYFNNALNKAQYYNDIDREGSILNNIGMVYAKQENFKKALDYYERALSLKKMVGKKWRIASTLTNIGEVYDTQGKNQLALANYKKSLILSHEAGDKIGYSETLVYMSRIYIEEGKYKKAIESLNQAIQTAIESGSKPGLQIAYEEIVNAYVGLGDYKNAYLYMKKSKSNNQELSEQRNTRNIYELQIKFDTEKTEKEIELLKKNALIKHLNYRRNMAILISIILFVVLILLTTIHYNRYHRLKVKAARQNLEDLLKLKADFTAMLVHDLRGPLTGIIGNADLLKIKYPHSEIDSIADIIVNSSEKMLNLVNEMLDLSRFEAGKMEIQYFENDIHEVINNAETLLLPLAQKKKITIHTLTNDKLKPFNFDAKKIEQVIINLLGNAIKFSSENTKIEINILKILKHDNWFMEISFKDEGPGIDSNQQEFIFDKYAQIKNSEKMNSGTGLGLAISKLIIDAHNGEIGIKSGDHHGSIFYFRLPLNQNQI